MDPRTSLVDILSRTTLSRGDSIEATKVVETDALREALLIIKVAILKPEISSHYRIDGGLY